MRSKKALAYVTKEETRVDGPFEFGEKPGIDKKDWDNVKE